MKDCNYYKEQAMLKLYNEEYDLSLNEHLVNCTDCSSFISDISNKLFSDTNIETKSILADKKAFILQKTKVNKKYFSIFNYKLAASAAIIFFIFLSSTYFMTDQAELKKIKSVKNIKSADTSVLVSNSSNGGETIKFVNTGETTNTLDSIENDISVMESELNSILEVDYNEII